MMSILTIDSKKYAVIPLDDYERLCEDRLPPLPEADENGLRSAGPAIHAVIARSIIKKQLALGMTQKELAQKAGIAVETLSRIETGKHKPQVATIDKISDALRE